MLVEERTALGKALGMGEDGVNVFQLRSRQAQKVVLDFHDLLAHHGTAVALDKVVHFRNAAGGGVFDGHHAVVDVPFLHRLDHIFKEGEIGFLSFSISKLLLHGFIGIGALGTVAAYPKYFIRHGNSSCLSKKIQYHQGRCVFNDRNGPGNDTGVVAAADGKICVFFF